MAVESKLRILAPPDTNVAKTVLVSIEEASTVIKAIIVEDYQNGVPIKETRSKVAEVISNTARPYLNKPRIFNQIRVGLMNLFNNAYTTHVANMKMVDRGIVLALSKKKMVDKDGNVMVEGKSYTISVDGLLKSGQIRPNKLITDDMIRGNIANIETAVPRIKDYEKLVRARYLELASMNPMVERKPLRVVAETEIRYEESLKDAQKIQDGDNPFYWASSHANCSKRCEGYQGKLFHRDAPLGATGYHEGHRWYAMNDALLGPNQDGNGFTSGHGCRHYFIEHRSGSTPPRQFDAKTIEKERELDRKQRYYENQIRLKKQEEALWRAQAKNSGEPLDKFKANKYADTINQRWKKQEERYEQLSLRNGRPFYRWRTQVFRESNNLNVE